MTISKADIYFDQIGCFGTKVVYLSPRKDEFLTDVNIQVNRILSNHFEIADNGNYLPEEWIPHCALAVQLDEKQFENALKIAQTENLEMTGKVIKLAVVKCNPYRDVKIFDID